MRIPKYRKHSSGQARVTLNGQTYYLRRFGSETSKRDYKRLVAEFVANEGVMLSSDNPSDVTIAEMVLAYLVWSKRNYGKSNGEYDRIRLIIKRVGTLYSDHRAKDFG